MIQDSGEEFVSGMKARWTGREVIVSKTTPMNPISIKIENAQLAGWEEVDRRIQKKHDRSAKFVMVSGPAVDLASGGEKDNLDRYLVIPVDDSTVYDVREDRLVVLTDREVVQFTLAGH